jgi:hypothetical protein
MVRRVHFSTRMPQKPEGASFFVQQAAAAVPQQARKANLSSTMKPDWPAPSPGGRR